MAVSWGTNGTVGTGSTSVTPGLPSGLTNGTSGVIIHVITKPDTATINTPSGWTLLASVAGGGGTTGNQVGPTRQAWFFREKDSGWSTMPAISITSGNSSAAIAYRVEKASGETFSLDSTTGVFGTSGTTTNATTTLGLINVAVGDLVIVGYSNMNDGVGYSLQSITSMSSLSFPTLTEISEDIETTTGNDVGGMSFRGIAGGSGSTTDDPITSATLTAAGRGTVVMVRVRADAPPSAQTMIPSGIASAEAFGSPTVGLVGPPPSFRSLESDATVPAATSITLDPPAGLTSSDAQMVIIEHSSADDPVTGVPSGWVQRVSYTNPHSGGEAGENELVQIFTAKGPTGSATFTKSGTVTKMHGIRVAYKDAGDFFGWDTDPQNETNTRQTTHTIPSQTTTDNNTLVISITTAEERDTGTTDWTAPGGWTERYNFTADEVVGGDYIHINLADRLETTPTTVSGSSWTSSQGSWSSNTSVRLLPAGSAISPIDLFPTALSSQESFGTTVVEVEGGGGGPATIVPNHLATEGDTSNIDTFTTVSIAPAANRLLLFFGVTSGANPAAAGTVSGLGLTWTTEYSNAGAKTQWFAYAQTGGSAPTPGTLSVSHGGVSQTGLAYSIIEVEGYDTTDPIVQVNHTRSNSNSQTVTLSALEENSATFAAFWNPSGETITPGGSYVELGENGHSAPLTQLNSQWLLPGTTTPSASWTTAAASGGLAVEVRAGTTTGGGAQTLTPSSVASAEAHGTQALATILDIAPSAIASLEVFGTTVLTPKITLSPTAIASLEAFGTTVLTPRITLAPSGVVTQEAFGTTVLTPKITLSPSGIATLEAFGTTAAYPKQLMSPGGIATAEVFGTTVLTPKITLSPSGIATLEVFGLTAAYPKQLMSPSAIATVEAFGLTAAYPKQLMSPSGIASAQAFGSPVMDFITTMQAAGIASAEALGSLTVSTVLTIVPTGIASAQAFGTTVVTTKITMSPTGVASAQVFGSPATSSAITLTPNGIATSEQIGAPVLAAVVTMQPPGIASQAAYGSLLVSTSVVLAPSGVPSAQAIGTPTLHTGLTLIPTGIASALVFGTQVIHTLLDTFPTSIATAEVFGNPVLLPQITLVPVGIATQESAGSPSVATLMVVNPGGIATAEGLGEPALVLGDPPTFVYFSGFGIPI